MMNPFGAIGNAMKGGMKPGLVKKMLPGMGNSASQKMGGVPRAGGIGPSPNAFGKSALMNKVMPQGGGIPPPDPNTGVFGGMKTGMGINRPFIPPDPSNMMMPPQMDNEQFNMPGSKIMPPEQGMAPSPQGMQELMAKMRARNTGINGKRAMMPQM
jgi:hypothetical protein